MESLCLLTAHAYVTAPRHGKQWQLIRR